MVEFRKLAENFELAKERCEEPQRNGLSFDYKFPKTPF